MSEADKRARIAGAVYLLASIPAFFSLMYVPNALIVSGDTGATIGRILASQMLFRWGMAAELLGAALWVLVPLALYRLLADVDRAQGRLMLALGLMAVPIMSMNVLNEFAVLNLLFDPRYGGFPPGELQSLVGLSLRAHSQGFIVAGVFWGAWLFPFAILVWRSGFLPKALAVLLTIGGVGWLASSATALLAPAYGPAIHPFVSIATGVGEIPVMVWLIVAGARSGRRRATSAATVAPAAR